ncbi:MAG: beta-phosphoglucomutase [Tindallia sp. MSAO_Bac2]|nr:MAG: beta-phosphoglucomutase [Tindallia sp. MSAO_Bac2]
MFCGFIFDLDGVIVDTVTYHYYAWKKLAHQLGFYLSPEINESLKGVSRMEALEILLKDGKIHATEADKKAWASKKNEWYLEYLKDLGPKDVLPGVLDFFEEIKFSQYKIALGSASKNAKTILEKLDMLNYFDFITDGTMTQKAKPDPEVFLLAAQGMGCPPSECLVFEDAIAGIIAAKKAGMKVVGIGDAKVLEKADLVFPDFENISMSSIEPLK